jgi:nitrite reductase/ring-hydroxylating ferredoxin subunit
VQCGPATEPVKSWPVKIENGRVFLALYNADNFSLQV